MNPDQHQQLAAAFTVDEFCTSHRLSRSALYRAWREGIGPRFFRNGSRILISAEAAAAWRREREDAEFAEAR
jgi:hypothetical protein